MIDYKTGRQRGLNLHERRSKEASAEKFRKLLVKGRGVQLALYALATHALRSFATCSWRCWGWRMNWSRNFIWRTRSTKKIFGGNSIECRRPAVFGMLGRVHTDYGFAYDYPLATLAIDEELLKQKWAITHPALALEPGGMSHEQPDRPQCPPMLRV